MEVLTSHLDHVSPRHIPLDIWILILKWIHPLKAFRIAHVCKSFQKLIYSAAYAAETLDVHKPGVSSFEEYGMHAFFLRVEAPDFQRGYVNKLLKGREILLWNYSLSSRSKYQKEAPIPSALFLVTSLNTVYLAGAFRNGRIPAEIKEWKLLKNLDLAGNSLEGPIPAELALLSNLRSLNLSHNNRLGGPLLEELANLKLLEYLNLSCMALEGPIPPAWGGLSSLQDINLQGNLGICGSIPAEIGDLRSLRCLSFTGCSLEGQIPKELAKLENLSGLFLSSNFLSGVVPEELKTLKSLCAVELYGNKDLECLFEFEFAGDDEEEEQGYEEEEPDEEAEEEYSQSEMNEIPFKW
ncbi:hypothetical protein HDU79_009429 [Rhizoclosmatium sp. JEL0117]|nr:hypothetical protein HDU79_009429 [Rhizoclosmatium sp. JEL0117]